MQKINNQQYISEKILKKFKDKLPIICNKITGNKIQSLEKNKYLVPKNLKISEFIYILRKRTRISEKESIFIYINNIIPVNTLTFEEIYYIHKKEDGILYIEYGIENTFG